MILRPRAFRSGNAAPGLRARPGDRGVDLKMGREGLNMEASLPLPGL